VADNLILIQQLIEKPAPEEAPSNLAIAGRYILTPGIFDKIRKVKKDKSGEIQLTNAIRLLLAEEAAYGLRFNGTRYDIGSKLDFLKTNVEFALKNSTFGKDFYNYLTAIVKSKGGHK